MTVLNAPVGLDATGQLVPGHPAGLAVWSDTDSSTLVCRQVQEITHDVRTFLFEPGCEPVAVAHRASPR